MASNTTLQKNLDAFYTHPKIARFCLDLLRDLIVQNLGLDLNAFHFLEPSAGNGSFVDALKGLGIADCLALDIAPKAQGIQKKDYLLELIEFNQKRVIIGNPPFGHRGKLALDFLNKSLNEVPIVAFILPNLFKRYSIQKHIDKRAKLVLNADLEKNAFIFNERPYDVKCVFQIYMHKNIALNLKDECIIAPPKIRHNDFITYIHNNTPHTLKYFNKEKYQWDFAVVRQGFYDYNEKITNANLLIKNRQYFFIKAHSKEALMIIHKIDFNKLAHKNTQVLGFSTYDFRECMLEKVFQEITNKRKFFASSSTGEQFENKFRNELKKHFSEINGDLTEELSHIEEKPNKEIKTTFNQLKKQVLEKNHPHTLKNPFSNLTSHFLYQPFGSQNYPDFLVFIFDYVVGIEIKFSKNDKGEKNLQTSRPIWNSNLPKPNAIYLYGVANADITFFKGSDILSYETREVLLKYFDTLDKDEESLKSTLKDLENPFGFAPYIRKAYEHKKEFSNHHQIENFFSHNHILREQNVLKFLKTLIH